MITFEEAYTIAKKLKPDIDGCTEYEKGYVFGCQADDMCYGKGPVVILKKDKRAVIMPYFIGVVGTGKEIREIPLPKE